jgi:hypothetical protein
VLARERDSLLAVAGLRADLEPGTGEHLDEVEPDDRLVFGDQDPHRRQTRSSPTGTCHVQTS